MRVAIQVNQMNSKLCLQHVIRVVKRVQDLAPQPVPRVLMDLLKVGAAVQVTTQNCTKACIGLQNGVFCVLNC